MSAEPVNFIQLAVGDEFSFEHSSIKVKVTPSCFSDSLTGERIGVDRYSQVIRIVKFCQIQIGKKFSFPGDDTVWERTDSITGLCCNECTTIRDEVRVEIVN